jgi:hypothetical protein
MMFEDPQEVNFVRTLEDRLHMEYDGDSMKLSLSTYISLQDINMHTSMCVYIYYR